MTETPFGFLDKEALGRPPLPEMLERAADAPGYGLYRQVGVVWKTELVTYNHRVGKDGFVASVDRAGSHPSVIIG